MGACAALWAWRGLSAWPTHARRGRSERVWRVASVSTPCALGARNPRVLHTALRHVCKPAKPRLNAGRASRVRAGLLSRAFKDKKAVLSYRIGLCHSRYSVARKQRDSKEMMENQENSRQIQREVRLSALPVFAPSLDIPFARVLAYLLHLPAARREGRADGLRMRVHRRRIRLLRHRGHRLVARPTRCPEQVATAIATVANDARAAGPVGVAHAVGGGHLRGFPLIPVAISPRRAAAPWYASRANTRRRRAMARGGTDERGERAGAAGGRGSRGGVLW